jgi:Zn-dependent protease with chaperone function
VLAHELGHHLGGHAWASLLRFWYSLPAMYAFSFAIFLNLAVTAALRSGNLVTNLAVGVVVVGFLGYLVVTIPIVGITAVVLVLLPFGLLWIPRAQEFEADALAATLGYGEALEQLLIATAPPNDKARPSLLRRVGETHPPNIERAQRLASVHLRDNQHPVTKAPYRSTNH